MRSLSLVLIGGLCPLSCVAQNNPQPTVPPLQTLAASDFPESLPSNGPSPLLFAPTTAVNTASTHLSGPVRIAPSIMDSRLQHRVDPVLPASAALAHGAVTFEARIDRSGCVRSLKVVQGPPALLASAQQAVRQWTYQPYLLDGQPTEVLTKVTVNFESVR